MASTTPGRQMMLTIPPELRNDIYHLVATGIEAIKIDAYRYATGDTEAMQHHPLSLTCRQLWKEFSPVYACLANQSATTLEPRLTNFALPEIYTFVTGDRTAIGVVTNDVGPGAILDKNWQHKDIIVHIRLTPTVSQTFNLLMRYALQVRQQGQTVADSDKYAARCLRHPAVPNAYTRLHGPRYYIDLQLDAADIISCRAQLDHMLTLVAGDASSFKEGSRIKRCFEGAVKRVPRRIKVAMKRLADREMQMATIAKSLRQHGLKKR